MVKINLLPHREARRKLRQKEFVALLLLGAVVGGLIVLMVGGYFSARLSSQQQRNNFIKQENAKLDHQIREVADLKQDIAALKARQQAVEDLQADRNQPVYLMDELAQQVPEGVYLKSFKQDGQRVALDGYAQSNERVSELLRNLGNNSVWLDHPDLIEIHAVNLGQGKDAKKVFEFNVNVDIRRPSEVDQKAADGGKAKNASAKTARKS